MDMQARMAPDDIERMSGEWKTVLNELDSLFSTFLDDVAATINEGWSGPGARAALGTMRSYVGNARTTLGQAHTLSDGLNVLASATTELQQNIAVPSDPAPAGKAGEVLGWGTPFAQDFSRWEQALNQVLTVYSDPAVRAGNAVAELIGPQERLRFGSGADVDLPEVVDRPEDKHDEQAERAEEFLSRWGLGEPDAVHGNTGIPLQIPLRWAGIPVSPFSDRDFGSGSASGSGDDELGEDDVYANQNWMRDPLWNENPTRSAGFETAMPVSGQAPTALSPDRIPGVVGGPAGTTAGGGPTTRPGGSMMPMMGMYPPHAGQRRGDENEHYSPPYLVNRDNTRELLGELPKGAAPVIGLWDCEDDDDIGPPARHGFRSR